MALLSLLINVLFFFSLKQACTDVTSLFLRQLHSTNLNAQCDKTSFDMQYLKYIVICWTGEGLLEREVWFLVIFMPRSPPLFHLSAVHFLLFNRPIVTFTHCNIQKRSINSNRNYVKLPLKQIINLICIELVGIIRLL